VDRGGGEALLDAVAGGLVFESGDGDGAKVFGKDAAVSGDMVAAATEPKCYHTANDGSLHQMSFSVRSVALQAGEQTLSVALGIATSLCCRRRVCHIVWRD